MLTKGLMKPENKVIISKPIFISNVIMLCLMAILLLFLIQYPMQYDNPIFCVLSALIFMMVFFWKYFIILICGVSIAGLVGVLKSQRNSIISPWFRIMREIIFLTLGLSLSTAAGFIFSIGIKSGKPDINPAVFLSYFNALFISYLTVRIGIGLLLYVRNAK